MAAFISEGRAGWQITVAVGEAQPVVGDTILAAAVGEAAAVVAKVAAATSFVVLADTPKLSPVFEWSLT